ncbi:methyltransferase domain-containing protein [Polynucleobacter paneuropaeus]|nr:methyltransferase domain-containing protein [Polynucleobacter paneuropaeus]
MRAEILEFLRCPATGQRLVIEAQEASRNIVNEGWLVSEDGLCRYKISNGIPRFVAQSNYADNFGMQWNHFRLTQLDSHSGVSISSDRFWSATNWSPEIINDQWVLDVGCGAGRFAEVALLAGAKVVALDYSSAVDACYENLKSHPNLYLVQGDIYALPFAKGSFPFVYSLGVLQHTPDVGRAFAALPPMVKNGGALVVDFYWKRLRTMLHAKYLFRPLTKRIPQAKLFLFLESSIPFLLAISRALGSIPIIGLGLKRIVPIADYTGRFPLSEEQLKEWALLDTFDMLAPAYDNPQTEKTVRRWFEQAGMIEVTVGHWAHLVGRAVKQN